MYLFQVINLEKVTLFSRLILRE